jgi:hypothetical protein
MQGTQNFQVESAGLKCSGCGLALSLGYCLKEGERDGMGAGKEEAELDFFEIYYRLSQLCTDSFSCLGPSPTL